MNCKSAFCSFVLLALLTISSNALTIFPNLNIFPHRNTAASKLKTQLNTAASKPAASKPAASKLKTKLKIPHLLKNLGRNKKKRELAALKEESERAALVEKREREEMKNIYNNEEERKRDEEERKRAALEQKERELRERAALEQKERELRAFHESAAVKRYQDILRFTLKGKDTFTLDDDDEDIHDLAGDLAGDIAD